MDDATRERVLDSRIERRLRTDSAYRNAESADEQAEREDEIAGEEERKLDFELRQRDMSEAHAEGLHDDVPREFCPECEAQGRRA